MATYPDELLHGIKMPMVSFRAYDFSLPVGSAREAKRIKNPADIEEVQLYLPGGFSEGVGATWGFEDIINIADGLKDETANLLKNTAASVVGTKLTNSMQAGLGKTVGPTDLMLFQKPNPYSISFNYTFVPRNAKEGLQIRTIIGIFKKSVLPKYQDGIIFANLKYPPIWDITFGGIKGPGDPSGGTAGATQYRDMALTNCTVSYSGGANSALVFHDGTPVECSMSLSFQSISYGVLDK